MPINEDQRLFIQTCIEPLVDLPCELDALTLYLQKLKHALTAKNQPTNPDEACLENILHDPAKFLFRLEDTNESITVTEVKAQIVRCIGSIIQECAEELPLGADMLWNDEEIIREVSSAVTPTPFRTGKSRTADMSNPLALETRDKIFQGFILGQLPWIYLNVCIKMTGSKKTIDLNFPYEPIIDKQTGELISFSNDNDEFNYLCARIPSATEHAEKIAAKYAINHLAAKKRLDKSKFYIEDNNKKRFEIATAGAKVITHQFYFKQIDDGVLDINDLACITEVMAGEKERARQQDQADTLLDPSIIDLITNELMSIKMAIRLSVTKRLFFTSTYYFNLLKNDRLPMARWEILILEDDQVRMLIHPAMINFQKLELMTIRECVELSALQFKLLTHPTMLLLLKYNKISIAAAKKLPESFLRLIEHPFYSAFILNEQEPIDWNLISKLDTTTSHFLLRKDIKEYVSEKKLSFNQTMASLPHVFIPQYGVRLTYLLWIGKIALNNLKEVMPTVMKAVDTHPFLFEWLHDDVIEAKNLAKQSLFNVFCASFSDRLAAIYHKYPFAMKNGIDTLGNVLSDMEAICAHDSFAMDEMREVVIKHFIHTIKINLIEKTKYGKNVATSNLFTECLERIKQAEQFALPYETTHCNYWQHFFCKFIIDVESMTPVAPPRTNFSIMRSAMSSPLTYFNSNSSPTPAGKDPSQRFIKNLKTFAPLIDHLLLMYPRRRVKSFTNY